MIPSARNGTAGNAPCAKTRASRALPLPSLPSLPLPILPSSRVSVTCRNLTYSVRALVSTRAFCSRSCSRSRNKVDMEARTKHTHHKYRLGHSPRPGSVVFAGLCWDCGTVVLLVCLVCHGFMECMATRDSIHIIPCLSCVRNYLIPGIPKYELFELFDFFAANCLSPTSLWAAGNVN